MQMDMHLFSVCYTFITARKATSAVIRYSGRTGQRLVRFRGYLSGIPPR
jgi:hypothetical protein